MQEKFSIVRRGLRLAVWLALLATTLSINGQTTEAERTEIFEEVWSAINEKYYDPQFNGVDWLKVKSVYRTRLATIASERDFYALLDRMAGELRDSHTRVYSPAQREERLRRRRGSVGIAVRQIERVPVITEVALGSEAESLGIKAGMTVVSVNGRPVGDLISETRNSVGISSSERAAEMRVFSKILAGELNSELNLELKNAAGETRKYTLTRRVVASVPRVEGRILSKGIAYLKFNQFDESIEREIGEFLLKFRTAPALVIDLRANRGGDGEMGLRFAGRFFKDKVTVARLQTRTGKPPVEGMPMTLETAPPADAQIFSRPVAILIDAETASTAELVANIFQEQERARLFGTNSCGCVLAFLDYKAIKGGGDLTLSEFGFLTPKGRRLEGEGVKPDQRSAPALSDVQNGRDQALFEAARYLEQKVRAASNKPGRFVVN